MMYERFSPKQLKAMLWWKMPETKDHDAIVCDGSVRSVKTLSMTIGFVLWSCTCFNGESFAFCGKTIDSLKRNVITPMQKWLEGVATPKLNLSRNCCEITIGKNTNRFYFFGGKDESSYQLIQGLTLAGVLFDEAALMPRSFVEQAIARCSVSDSKFWFNCNPDKPHHWFNVEWIDEKGEKAEAVKAKNRLHLHFTMKDNYALSETVRERYERMYSGVFYDRYILGLWTSADGIIYRLFAENTQAFVIDTPPDDIVFCTIGWDFGGNGSAHAGICTGFSRAYRKVVILEEYYRKEIISPEELERDYINFVKKCQSKYKVFDAYPDSAEQVLIKGFRKACARAHVPIEIHNARKSEILGRIRFTDMIMSQGRFAVMRHCKHVIEALKTAVWDSNSNEDIRLDDGNYNIDSLDAFEYSFEAKMNEIIEMG